MYSMCYLRPGQMLESSKVPGKPRTLIASEKAFRHFVDYTNEAERMAVLAEKEAKRLALFKKETYEISKTWDNTVENIKRKRKENFLANLKKEEEERIRFVKEMTEKNAEDQAEIVERARKLLLYRKPQCRLINGALLTSECLRELNAQLEFNKTLVGIEKEKDAAYADTIKKDAVKHAEEERKKAEEQMKKNRIYRDELRKQMQGNGNDLKRLEKAEKEAEREDLKNMTAELEIIKQCEAEETKKKKKLLNKLFIDAMEEKKACERKLEHDKEFQDRALEVYTKAKRQIEKKLKAQLKKEKEEKLRHSELLAKKCAVMTKSRAGEEEERIRKAEEEKEAARKERDEARKQHEEKIRAEMEKYRQDLAFEQEKQKRGEQELKVWETLQRFKRDEFNKEFAAKSLEEQRKKQKEVADTLQRQMVAKEKEQKRIEMLEGDSNEIKQIIEKTNEKILRYGEEVLEESKGVRRLFPIVKAIEQFKKEIGLKPPIVFEETTAPQRKWKRKRRPACAKPIPDDQIYYL